MNLQSLFLTSSGVLSPVFPDEELPSLSHSFSLLLRPSPLTCTIQFFFEKNKPVLKKNLMILVYTCVKKIQQKCYSLWTYKEKNYPPPRHIFLPTYLACCSVHSMIFSLLSSGRDSSFSCFSLSNCINWVTFFLLKLKVRFRIFKSNNIIDR